MSRALVDDLKLFFQNETSVSLAFLFGSRASGRDTADSDVDVALYLDDVSAEGRLWSELSRLVHRELDLVVLNNAPETMLSAVVKTGVPLLIRDSELYWRIYLWTTNAAEDFSDFVDDYVRIRRRSASLSPEDRTRLARRLQFLEDELSDLPRMSAITADEYRGSRQRRREIERWAENIANALIDCAKIVLASQHAPVPRGYAEALAELARRAGLPETDVPEVEGVARLRNLIAHEYLDLLFSQIKVFLESAPRILPALLGYLRSQVG